MRTIKWSKRYSLDVDEIDSQHRKLFLLAGTLEKAISKKLHMDAVTLTIPELVKYIDYHFSTEEHYMELFGYPGFNEHKADHERFKGNLAVLIDLIISDVDGVMEATSYAPRELLDFIGEWIDNHISKVDRKLCDFLKERGIK